jgi:hypothetical protein
MNNQQPLNPKTASLILFLFLTALFLCVGGLILYLLGLLPLEILIIAGAIGGLLTIICAIIQTFQKFLSRMWLGAKNRKRLAIWSALTSLVLVILVAVPALVSNHALANKPPSAIPTKSASTPGVAAANSATQSVQQTPGKAPVALPSVDVNAPNPYGGTLLFSDSLLNLMNSNPHSWNGSGGCIFSADGYHVKAIYEGTPYNSCRDDTDDFTNFALQVHVRLTPGSAGGFIFRYTGGDNPDDYIFSIDHTGNYTISRTDNGHPVDLRRDRDPIQRDVGDSYVLAVVANGPLIEFYVNGVKIDSIHDSKYSHGLLGFVVDGASDNLSNSDNTEAIFTDAKVWRL